MRFELQRTQLLRHTRWSNNLGVLFSLVPLIIFISVVFVVEGAGLLAWIVVVGGLSFLALMSLIYINWYAKRYVESLDYQLEDNIIHVEEGVFTYQRKAIPLDRVTDIRLIQGVLMRWLGIWRIDIQTASSGEGGAEGTLWAVEAPKEVRNQLLAARKQAVLQQRLKAAA